MESKESKLIIGLGNPGSMYEKTYHNVGQLFIDYLAGADAKFRKAKHFEYCRTNDLITDDLMTLVKTLTFMNHSGTAVAAAKKHFRFKPSELLVVHDDSDIPLGHFKLSFGRGSAGHQGIESVIKALRTNKFYRLRIGIRPSREVRRTKANDLVLKRIPTREIKVLRNLFSEVVLKINSKAHSAIGL